MRSRARRKQRERTETGRIVRETRREGDNKWCDCVLEVCASIGYDGGDFSLRITRQRRRKGRLSWYLAQRCRQKPPCIKFLKHPLCHSLCLCPNNFPARARDQRPFPPPTSSLSRHHSALSCGRHNPSLPDHQTTSPAVGRRVPRRREDSAGSGLSRGGLAGSRGGKRLPGGGGGGTAAEHGGRRRR